MAQFQISIMYILSHGQISAPGFLSLGRAELRNVNVHVNVSTDCTFTRSVLPVDNPRLGLCCNLPYVQLWYYKWQTRFTFLTLDSYRPRCEFQLQLLPIGI